MFIADYHTHSNCSPDGTVPMIEMAKAARTMGLSELCLTDHCDLLSLDGKKRTTEFDWQPILSQRKDMLQAFGREIQLPMGLEFGMSFLDSVAAEKILKEPGLDFVIGAVHNHSEKAGGSDFYFADYETEDDCYRALDDYFDSVLALSKTDYYDVLGHISYPLRYMRGDYKQPISLYRYTDHIRLMLTRAADKGRGMEVNTWKGQTLSEWIPILKLFKECHGEIITVGSDAHATAPLGGGIKEAYTMLGDFGFRYVAVYRERKPEFIKL
ncbi:MAG: histidinol-phosphatase HisJ family protein [Evtepia sp.]